MRVSICLCVLIIWFPVHGQRQLSTKSKKATELYYQADNYRVRGQYRMALDLLKQAIQKDKNFHEAHFRIAVIQKAKGELDEAEASFQKVIQLNDGIMPQVILNYQNCIFKRMSTVKPWKMQTSLHNIIRAL